MSATQGKVNGVKAKLHEKIQHCWALCSTSTKRVNTASTKDSANKTFSTLVYSKIVGKTHGCKDSLARIKIGNYDTISYENRLKPNLYILSMSLRSVLTLLSRMAICSFLASPHNVWFIYAIKKIIHITLFPESLSNTLKL